MINECVDWLNAVTKAYEAVVNRVNTASVTDSVVDEKMVMGHLLREMQVLLTREVRLTADDEFDDMVDEALYEHEVTQLGPLVSDDDVRHEKIKAQIAHYKRLAAEAE